MSWPETVEEGALPGAGKPLSAREVRRPPPGQRGPLLLLSAFLPPEGERGLVHALGVGQRLPLFLYTELSQVHGAY